MTSPQDLFRAVMAMPHSVTAFPEPGDHNLGKKANSPLPREEGEVGWTALGRWLKYFGQDAMFWWTETGSILGKMMDLAGYDKDSQQRNLLFYYIYIAPTLGRKPTADGEPAGWKSFMTDDFSPLEFSWDWGRNGSNGKPSVRFSVEPIGRDAGTPVDPLNENMTPDLIDCLRSTSIGSILDMTLFNQFKTDLTTTYEELRRSANSGSLDKRGDHRSQMFLAFDLSSDSPVLKAYFLPGLKSVQSDMSVPDLVSQAVDHCAAVTGLQLKRSYDRLQAGMDAFPLGYRPDIEIVGIDCVVPDQSRVKVYVRHPSTSFDSVLAMLQLGSQAPLNPDHVADLRELWTLLLGLPPNHPDFQELPTVVHRTSGILYYYELKPNSNSIVPKIYIPVRHYGVNDLAVSQALTKYFERRGQGLAVGNYVEELSNIFPHRSLESGLGLHTYVSCVFKKTGVAVTSYFNPEVYHAGRHGQKSAKPAAVSSRGEATTPFPASLLTC